MQKRSHTLLAQTLLRTESGFGARRFEWAFLFGSFQPDVNPFSYLKGSIHYHKLKGHNYVNSRQYINAQIRKLQRRDRWTVWQYYTLGKLTHYLADAYTYPHNENYPDSMLNHHNYETNLRAFLRGYLAHQYVRRQQARRDLIAALEELHEQYMSTRASMYRDASYILKATSLLMAGCLPAA
ncbi:MAG: zinc dependent phospholipase C family protein [Oscillibacter sp.]|nr:zinc dependent phospholipase C family protein [Oscillibacter sp.]